MMESTKVSGIYIDENRFTTITTLGWLVDKVIGGMTLEETLRENEDKIAAHIESRIFIEERTLKLAKIRAKMQRPFQVRAMAFRKLKGELVSTPTWKPTAKYRNAFGPLKKYMIYKYASSPKDMFGVLPAFVLFWPEKIPNTQIEHNVPMFSQATWTAYDFSKIGRGVIIDGECRVAAALSIRADLKVPHTIRDKLLQQLVTVEVFHGLSEERAAQAFIDLNTLGVPVDSATRTNIDPGNKWVEATKKIFDELGVKLATNGRQITRSHLALGKKLMITHGVQMVKALVMGVGAITKRKDGPKSWEGVDFDRLHTAGLAWFREIFNHFQQGDDILHDKDYVIRSVPVRVALASLGQAHYAQDLDGRKIASEVLSSISWKVSMAWNGLGGKVTRNEAGKVKMASGSGKEHCSVVLSALTKPTSHNGKAIRNKS